MKIIVTGGEGFIGKHLIQRLKSNGHDVLSYDLKSGLDIINYEQLSLIISSFMPDVIVHLAALCIDQESIDKPQEYMLTNVLGTINVLECARKLKIKKVVFISSAGVYNPRTPYAYSKFDAESWCNMYSQLYNMIVYRLRLFNVYGEGNDKGVINNFIKSIKEGKPIIVHNDGEYYRDYIHVKDVVEDITICVEGDIGPHNNSYDIGTGKAYSVNEIIAMLSNITGKKIQIINEKVDNLIKLSVMNSIVIKKHINLEEGLRDLWSKSA